MEKDLSENVTFSSLKNPDAEEIIRLQATLIELAHDAIIIRDPRSRIMAWNSGAQNIYGWSAEEVIGQVTHELLQTRFPESLEAVDLALEQHGHWEGQLTHLCKDGSWRIVDSRQVLVKQDEKRSAAILEVNRDVTEQMRLQRERADAQTAALALRETTSQMNAFLGVISHELKTPITSVKGNIQLARRQLMRLLQIESALTELAQEEMHPIAMIRKLLDRAERQIDIQSRLVNDLVDVSRIENDQLTVQPEPCDLVKIIRQAIEDQLTFTPTRIIHWECALPQATVVADADRIGQVMHNYLSNALKYSEVEKPVIVRLERVSEVFQVSVQDNGPGLSPEQQIQVWKRFVRLEEIETRSGGSIGLGLGLYICSNLIASQGGQVGVVSTVGDGSTFWFTLPVPSEMLL